MTTLAGDRKGFFDGPALSSNFSIPEGVASDIGGNVFVSDYFNNRIRRIDVMTGMVSTVAGSGGGGEVN